MPLFDSTQVDHVVVFRYGLFVIETKCLKSHVVSSPSRRRVLTSVQDFPTPPQGSRHAG
ncbi:nuclease-related domain-containing protein [Azotobacter beijerinckii]|uniref:nuclease-related domain-containing protein n=1 Tax=Azotobacter beijerinckii TaxID=170623 RepID=UPI000B89E541